jgi:hypothetical protein
MRGVTITSLLVLVSINAVTHAAGQMAPSPAKLPVDVVMFVLERVSCDNLLAKDGTAPALSKHDPRLYVRCPVPDEVEKNLRQKYASNPDVIRALDDPKSAAGKAWTIYPPLGSQSPGEEH